MKSSANTRTWTVAVPVGSVCASSVTVVCIGCARPAAIERMSSTDQVIVMLPRTPGDGHLAGHKHDYGGHGKHSEAIGWWQGLGAPQHGERAVESREPRAGDAKDDQLAELDAEIEAEERNGDRPCEQTLQVVGEPGTVHQAEYPCEHRPVPSSERNAVASGHCDVLEGGDDDRHGNEKLD